MISTEWIGFWKSFAKSWSSSSSKSFAKLWIEHVHVCVSRLSFVQPALINFEIIAIKRLNRFQKNKVSQCQNRFDSILRFRIFNFFSISNVDGIYLWKIVIIVVEGFAATAYQQIKQESLFKLAQFYTNPSLHVCHS